MSPEHNDDRGLGHKLRQAGRLSARDWLVLMQAGGWFAAVELGLRLIAVKRLIAILQRRDRARRGFSPSASPSRAPVTPDRLAYLVELAARVYPFGATCLKKALVLYALLQRRGVDVKLIIGATKTDRKLDAHAWLEHDGRVLIGGPAERYEPLCTLVG
ncbi:MAG TPA: lasso peptide biosynthesis B2 protein [Terriglobia bacterium]|nr:lasso peptide biosynthesis B2 protein [Terriglobia bacterium]